MAGASLFTLLDDIASILDDVSAMTKVAATKTTGVLGDDLALNAEQVSGVRAERELPVVWAVFKGSLRNKLILVPAALAISALAPWAITPLLMLGGAFLCYEGFEKLLHTFSPGHRTEDGQQAEPAPAQTRPVVDLVGFERDKIKGAIRTDFILSAEIIVITLGTVAAEPIGMQLAVLAGIAVLMTIGVYGLVAGIVKLDDVGLFLSQRSGSAFAGMQRRIGHRILRIAPYLMKGLSIIGTAAMFLVGGGILLHGLPGAHSLLSVFTQAAGGLPALGDELAAIVPLLLNALTRLVAGGLVLGGLTIVRRLTP